LPIKWATILAGMGMKKAINDANKQYEKEL
jgi:hypothetical protein